MTTVCTQHDDDDDYCSDSVSASETSVVIFEKSPGIVNSKRSVLRTTVLLRGKPDGMAPPQVPQLHESYSGFRCSQCDIFTEMPIIYNQTPHALEAVGLSSTASADFCQS